MVEDIPREDQKDVCLIALTVRVLLLSEKEATKRRFAATAATMQLLGQNLVEIETHSTSLPTPPKPTALCFTFVVFAFVREPPKSPGVVRKPNWCAFIAPVDLTGTPGAIRLVGCSSPCAL